MKYFGTDGFRGEANVNLNVVHAYKVGRFLGWYYGREHKARIIIGKDTRRSSYMFEDALSSGLTASGADVYLLHVTPTPSVSYVVRTEDFDCGIMISASHNPYYDNGLKVINGKGHKLEAEIEEKIEAYIDSPEDTIPMATRENIGCTVDYAIGRHRYIGYLMSLATRSFKNIRVGLDCANGSSYSVAKGVFDALGAKTYAIGMEPNGININDGCGSTHIENLQKFVKENNLDVGFAYDGDADRCLCVDEKGNLIDGDAILYIYGKYMKERGKLENNTVVTTVMSNFGLYKAFDEAGICTQPIPWDEKCFLNKTTSICGSDALRDFRHFYSEKIPTAVFMGSDGIDDSLKNEEDMYDFYKTILYAFSISDYTQAVDELKAYLPRLSKEGSADDVSIAAWMDMDVLKSVVDKIKAEAES